MATQGILQSRNPTIKRRNCWRFGGEPAGIRTRDLLIKSQLLYRLSYGLVVPGAP
jgi:hypothetical protein